MDQPRRARWRATRTATAGLAALACAVPVLAATAGPAAAATATGTAAASSWSSLTGYGTLWGDDTTGQGRSASSSGTWRASDDLGSTWSTAGLVGARSTWATRDASGRAVTGQGVTVALIDTGVSPVAGLDAPGKVVDGPDLSFDGQDPSLLHLDGDGHGTFMAGIIAGADARAGSDSTAFTGIAPGAGLLSVKVGAAGGAVDVTQVVAGIDWVVQHRRDQGMDVRVLNLSYGTDSTQGYATDALARAVEDAWRAGIVVVAAAGNEGSASSALTMPAADPYVIAVGASDHAGTATPYDDQLTSFTNPGTASRRPDVLAPGRSVVSLRVPGSVVDVDHPEGLVPGDAAGRYFRGSGTSEAAAVVSGAAALLLQARPSMTPDQVKAALVRSSSFIANRGSLLGTTGRVDVAAAVRASTTSAVLTSRQTWARSTGTGSLDASRGGDAVVDGASGVALTGEVDALGSPWDGAAWAAASSAGTAWSGGAFMGRTWTGSGWTGTQWDGAPWTGTSWTGADWAAPASSTGDGGWSGKRWSGKRWSTGDWSGSRWSGSRWSGSRWS